MTIGQYIAELAADHAEWEVQFAVTGQRYSAAQLLRGLDSVDAARPLVTETGTEGCFLLDSFSQQRLIQILWSPKRKGWLITDAWWRRVHYCEMGVCTLESLCGILGTSADSHLLETPPEGAELCKRCLRIIQARDAKVGEHATPRPNQTMERTAGSFGSCLQMKLHPQPAATRPPASRRSSYSR